jgi:hypothetical protein
MRSRLPGFCTVLSFAAFFLSAHLLAASNTWSSAASLNQARSGSAAVRLSDGRILFTGGAGASGPLTSTEFFNTGGSISAGASMQQPRTGHAAVLLQDGRMLVTGGTTTSNTVTNSAEIYDPASNMWTSVPNGMNTARSGETATLLNDGRVLIAGGQSTSGPTNTVEIFSPATNSFTLLSGGLSSPRQQHAAALLQDGRVLIAGGSDASKSLSSVDIYDPSSGVISSIGNMSAARAGLSATTLLDGTVLLAGGNDGSKDLSSADIYNPATPGFSATANLGAARSGHLAFLLPNNNQVLIAGGTAAGTTLQSVELFTPWTGAFTFTAPMSTPRSSAVGTALQQDGQLLVGMGTNGSGALSSTEVYSFATVKTDTSDYPPGTTVNILGSGWQPGETVTLTLVESPLYDTHGPYTAVADGNGNISNSQFVTDSHDADIRFYLTASGSSGLRAENTFTDGNATSVSGTVKDISGNGISGATVTCTSGCNNNPAASTTSGSGGGYVFDQSTTKVSFDGNGPVTLQLTASKSGYTSQTITLQNVKNGGSLMGNNFTLSLAQSPTSLIVQPATGTYGGTTTLSATLTSGGSGVNLKPITFTMNGTSVGSATTNSSGVATLNNISLSGINAGTYTAGTNSGVTANFAGDSSYQAASNSNSLSVAKATATINVTSYNVTYDGNPHTTTATATGVNNTTLTGVDVSGTKHTNAGTYTDSWTFTDSTGNYNNASGTVSDVIGKATPGITVTPYSITYDGNAHTATGSATGANNTTLSGLDLSGTTHANAGTYTDNWTFTDGTGNYTDATGAVYDAIAKATPQVTPTGGAFVYNGGPEPGACAVLPSTLTVTPSYAPGPGAPVNAGAYTLTCSVAATTNYNANSAPALITITAAVPVLPPAQSGSSTYGTSVTLRVTISSVMGGETPTGTVQFQFTNNNTTYNICLDGNLQAQPAATPCAITLDSTGTAKVTTSKLPAGITADAVTATYYPGDADYTGGTTTINYTVSQASTNTTVSVTPATGATYGDTITLAATVSDSTQTSTGTPTGTVQFQYSTDGTNWTNIGNPVTLDGSGNAQTTTSALPAGSPSVRVCYGGDANFTKSNSGPTIYAVNQKALTISGITAADKPYDGTTAATVNVSKAQLAGVIGSDDVQLVTSGAAGAFADANAGSGKAVTVNGLTLTGGAASNYKLTPPTTNASITQVTVTITASSATVTYGDPVPAITPGYSGFVNNEDSSVLTTQTTCTTTYTSSSNAGSAQTTSCSGAAATNYTFKYVGGTVTVNKANATINVTPYSVTYDGNARTATATATGVKSEDLSGSLNLSGTTHTNAGTYSSDAWTFTDTTGNYISTNGSVSDNIAKANATINVTPYSVTYDGNAHTATGSVTGVKGESLSGLDLSGTTHTNAGTYTDSWTFTDVTGNYTNASKSVSDNIGKATPQVTAIGGAFIYNAAAEPGSCSVMPNTLTVTPGYSTGSGAPINAGSYTLTCSVAATANYDANSANAAITIGTAITSSGLSSKVTPGSNGAVTVTATANVTNTSNGLPPVGTVTFSDTVGPIDPKATTSCTSSGNVLSCQLTFSTLSPGTHLISATFASSNFAPNSASDANSSLSASISQPDANNDVFAITSPVNLVAGFTGATVSNPNQSPTAQWAITNTGTHYSFTTAGTISGSTVTGSPTFTSGSSAGAGVYSFTLTCTDGLGGIVVANTVAGSPAAIIIYDPSAGFVTGGGWFISPAGADAWSPSATGKATFGFVSKYQKGMTVPSGDTEFQFEAGNFNFHSTAYTWMVISGGLAQYQGTGTINGSGTFNFMLTARDGALYGGGQPDGFRIRITDQSGTLVYDNLISSNTSMTSANTQALGGGSIIIHSN